MGIDNVIVKRNQENYFKIFWSDRKTHFIYKGQKSFSFTDWKFKSS